MNKEREFIEFFKYYDFRLAVTVGNVTQTISQKDAEKIAILANKKLNLALGPQVYGGGNKGDFVWSWSVISQPQNTDTGFLFNIQPIVKECSHKEVQIYDLTVGKPAFRCIDCKKMVEPKNGWTVADECD